MAVAEQMVPLSDRDAYIIACMYPGFQPEIVIHRGLNTLVRGREGDQKCVVKIPAYTYGHLWDLYKGSESAFTQLRGEAEALERLQDLEHVIGLLDTKTIVTNGNEADKNRVRQALLYVLKMPVNFLLTVGDGFSDPICSLMEKGNPYFQERQLVKITGLRTKYVEGATVGTILYGREVLEKNYRKAQEYKWGRAEDGRTYCFNGNSYVEIDPAEIPESPRRYLFEGNCGRAHVLASGEFGIFAPYSPVKPESFPWEFVEGVVYYQGNKIITEREVIDQLVPTVEEIHRRGIAGFDIRYPNIMIGMDGKAYFFDFDRRCEQGIGNKVSGIFSLSGRDQFTEFVNADKEDLQNIFNRTWHCRSELLRMGHTYS